MQHRHQFFSQTDCEPDLKAAGQHRVQARSRVIAASSRHCGPEARHQICRQLRLWQRGPQE
jgi:hypothetical protein